VPLTYDKNGIVTEDADAAYVKEEARINKIPVRQVENLPAEVTYPVNKLLLTGDPADMPHVEELMQQEHGDMDCIGLLCWLNYELFVTIDNTVSIELLSRLFSSQLVTKGERHLLSRNRTYYKLLRQIITQGQENGELTTDYTVGEIVKAYAMFERGLMYDWCLSSGEYSLSQYTKTMMPMFLEGFRKK